MSITEFQRNICRLISTQRRAAGESYLAGGVPLNVILKAQRVSRDIDLFHDTDEALQTSWQNDRMLLEKHGYVFQVLRDAATHKEAIVRKDGDSILLQWVRESAFRFFPLIEDDLFGLVLHPFDLATNKVLALAGRLEPRDWVDVLECNDKIQPLGYLAWAACGKDPGFNPKSLLAEARRSGRYSQTELNELAFEGSAPDAVALGRKWHLMLSEAEDICEALAGQETGVCLLNASGDLCKLAASQLTAALHTGQIYLHHGAIKGVMPSLNPLSPHK